MNSRIIYPTDDGVAVIIPAAECGLTIEEIAAKDVPSGKPFKIVDIADIPIIRAGYDTFTREELVSVYSQCFINLRLTPHDGCPNTNIEMGLMGRRSIYNGDLPASISWHSVDDICENILLEYSLREFSNKEVSKIYHTFVNYERMSTLFI